MLPLSLQLGATAKAVAFVMAGRSLNDVLSDGSVVKPDLRSGVQALSFSVLRHWGAAQAVSRLLVVRQPAPAVDALLGVTLALLMSEPDAGTTYTDFTLVNQAVEAAKGHSKTRSSANFINATLRRFLRERESLFQSIMHNEEAIFNHPQWWINQLRRERPSDWQDILAANQIKPSLTLRVNVTKTTVNDYQQLLAAEGLVCKVCSDVALIVHTPVSVMQLPHYKEGWFSVQDIAAQDAARQLLSQDYLAVLVERVKQGKKIRVLDACAAPGGKTTHLIERLLEAFALANLSVDEWGRYFEVVAIESDAKRVKRIHENLSRLKQRAVVKVADVAQLTSWWDGVPFDAVLLDAPCSASGIVRRHPDIRWLRRESDIAMLSQLQTKMLKALWQVVRTQGRLLYATCSIFEAEGDGAVNSFVQAQTDINRLDSHGLWLPHLLHDGFYDALFEKSMA